MYFIFQLVVNICQNLVIYIRAQMSDFGVQQSQFILITNLMEFCRRGRIQFCLVPAVLYVDFIDVFHKFERSFLAYMLVKTAAEIVCNVVLSVRKGARSAEAAHYRTNLTSRACFYFFAVDRALSLRKRIARFEHGNLFTAVSKFVGGKYTARTRADNNYVKFHFFSFRA